MNIDLLFTAQHECGLVSDESFHAPVAGIMYDAQTGFINLEFSDADSMELNIPVEQGYGQQLTRTIEMHVGIIEDGTIADNRQVPIVLLNDPFGGGNAGTFAVKPSRSVMAFETFMKNCSSGQPVNRDDLGDEDSANSVMGGINPAVLQFAPHLARQRTMEAAPKQQLAPKGPAMGMGGGGGGGSNVVRRIQKSNESGSTDDEK